MSIHRRPRLLTCVGLTLALATLLGPLGCASRGQAAEEAKQNTRRALSHLYLGADHLQSGRSALALRESGDG